MEIPADVEKAYKLALVARSRAHAPYSRFKVGAALKLKGVDTAVAGCNVENASFGGTICAERAAVVSAVSRHGKPEVEFLVIVTGEPQATVPCALCLQVLAEFCADGTDIYLGNERGILSRCKLKEFLPFPFRSFESSKA